MITNQNKLFQPHPIAIGGVFPNITEAILGLKMARGPLTFSISIFGQYLGQ